MTSTASSATNEGRSAGGPAGAFSSVLNSALDAASAKLGRTIAGWTDKLNGVAAGEDSSSSLVAVADKGLDKVADNGGAGVTAGAEGVKAHLHGQSAIWAAIKGAWESGTPTVRAAMVAAVVSLVLLLLLSPVVLLVFLISWAIIAAVHRARAAQR